jgi:hypothetical protein
MSRLCSSACVLLTGLAIALHAAPPAGIPAAAAANSGILTSSDPTQAPPFSPPSKTSRTAKADDPASAAIDPALRDRIMAAHAAWLKQAGNEFAPSLQFVGGSPILMLNTTPNEPAARKSRRLNAIVAECGFLLDDAAFDRAVVCVAVFDPKNPASTTTRNVEIKRGRFQAAAKKAGNVPDVAKGVALAAQNASVTSALCRDLGVD